MLKEDNENNKISVYNKIISYLKNISDKLDRILPHQGECYDVEKTISISQPTEPVNNINAYQFEDIKDFHNGTNAKVVHVENVSGGKLYVIYRHGSGDTNYSPESLIEEGRSKPFYDVAKIGVRSPTAGLRYKITEHDISKSASAKKFEPDRFGKTRDNSGVQVILDNYESPTLKFETTETTGGGTVARSTVTAYKDDFSLELITGAAAGVHTDVRYDHIDFHQQRIGMEIHFASADIIKDVHITMAYHDGTFAYQGNVFTGGTTAFNIIHNGGNTSLSTTAGLLRKLTGWNDLKLVIDVSTLKFVRAILNGISYDLSQYDLLKFSSSIVAGSVHNKVVIFGPTAGAAVTVYVDNYIFTEDEN